MRHVGLTAALLGVLSLIFFVAESYSVRLNYVTNKVTKKLRRISADEVDKKYDGKFVYISTSKVLYSNLIDSEFNVALNGGYFDRKVEYCQWLETSRPVSNNGQGVVSYSYKKVWSEEQINSDFFHDNRHINPITPLIQKAHVKGAIKVGSYDISTEMVNVGQTNRLIPSFEQLSAFTISPMQKLFRYIGRGYFYKEYQNGFSPIISQQFGYNTNGELSKESMKQLFIDCNPGDIKVKFTFWGPTEVSLIGLVNGTRIETEKYNNIVIGALVPGVVAANEIIKTTKTPATIFAWIARLLFAAFAIFISSTQSNSVAFVAPVTYLVVFCFLHSPGVSRIFNNFTSSFIGGIFTSLISTIAFLSMNKKGKNPKPE